MNDFANNHIYPGIRLVNSSERRKLMNQHPIHIWFTGLSGSGKSTAGAYLELLLHRAGIHTSLLDGDTLRGGICRGLGFSKQDRDENIRRAAETARLLLDNGLVVISTFISPLEDQRQMVKRICEPFSTFIAYMDCPLEVCENRDPKGLYQKARQGEIPEFTGVSSPYEIPPAPDMRLQSGTMASENLAEELFHRVYPLIKHA
jgi:adenylyl-sulfate kinase